MRRTDLSDDARELLAASGVTRAEWITVWWPASDNTWRGDVCGCTDDRCIGHHHDAGEACGCLPVLLAAHVAERATS